MHVRLDSTCAQKTYMGPYEPNDYFQSAHQCVWCITVDKLSCNAGKSGCKWESGVFYSWDLVGCFSVFIRRECFTCKHMT